MKQNWFSLTEFDTSNLEWDQITFSQLKINKTHTHLHVAAVSSWKFTKYKHFHAPSTLLSYLSWLVPYPHKPNQNQQHSSCGGSGGGEASKCSFVHLHSSSSMTWKWEKVAVEVKSPKICGMYTLFNCFAILVIYEYLIESRMLIIITECCRCGRLNCSERPQHSAKSLWDCQNLPKIWILNDGRRRHLKFVKLT